LTLRYNPSTLVNPPGPARLRAEPAPHRPAAEIAALAQKVSPTGDPEINYFSAAHLAYAGQTDAASTMLASAIAGGYCSYPAMDSDPALASLRSMPKFTELRAAGVQCQKNFLKDAATAAAR
jgi:hypothetical protein